MPSGLEYFRGFILFRALLTSAMVKDRVLSSWSSASLAVGMVLFISNRTCVELIGERGNGLGITAISRFIV